MRTLYFILLITAISGTFNHLYAADGALPTALPKTAATTATATRREITQFGTDSPFDVDYKSPLGGEGKRIWADSFLWEKAPRLMVEDWITSRPASLKGRFILIEIWATWCSQSRRAVPLMNALHKKFGKKLAVVAVSDEPAAAVRAFAQKNQITYALGVDPQGRMKRALGVKGIPHVILVEPGGSVVWEGFPLLKGFELTEQTVGAILKAGRKQ